MQHLDEGTIHAWLDAALSAGEAEGVARHAAECAECAAMVADARGLIAGAARIVSSLDVVRGDVLPSQSAPAAASASLWRKLRLTPARAAIAATLLIGVASMFAVEHQSAGKLDTVRAATRFVNHRAPEVAPAPAIDSLRSATPRARPDPIPLATSAKPKAVAAGAGDRASVPPVQISKSVTVPATPPAPAPVASRLPAAVPLSEIVTTSAVAVDSIRAGAKAFDATQEFRSNRAGAPAGNALQLGPSAFARTSIEGCYHIVLDSTAWLRGLPERFALARDSASGQNVVRSVSPTGRVDSVLVGGEWRQVPPNTTSVVFVSRVTATSPVTLRFALNASQAQLESGDRVHHLGLQRTACRP